jgi:hypothetical protein
MHEDSKRRAMRDFANKGDASASIKQEYCYKVTKIMAKRTILVQPVQRPPKVASVAILTG